MRSDKGVQAMTNDRSKEVYDIADGIYRAIGDALREAEVDAGQGIAICSLLSGWLRGSADAQTVLVHKGLADIPYYGESDYE